MINLAIIYIFQAKQLNFEVSTTNNIQQYIQEQPHLKLITPNEYKEMKKFYYTKAWLTAALIIGWAVVHPRFRKNIIKMFKEAD